MDLATLIKTNVDALNSCKKGFQNANDAASKKASFDEFMQAVTRLHTVYKGADLPLAAREKLQEIITAATKDAQEMKNNALQLPTQAPTLGKSPSRQNTTNQTNQKADGGKERQSDNDKDKAAFTEALQGAIITEKPNVKWEDVAGLKIAKQTLKEAIIFPTKFPDIFVGLRKPWKGILLYGVR